MFPGRFSELLMYNMITLVCGCPSVLATWVIVWWPGHSAICLSPLMCLLLNFSLKLCWNCVSLPFGKGDGLNVLEAGIFHCFLRNKVGSQHPGCGETWSHVSCFCHYWLSAVQKLDWVTIHCWPRTDAQKSPSRLNWLPRLGPLATPPFEHSQWAGRGRFKLLG